MAERMEHPLAFPWVVVLVEEICLEAEQMVGTYRQEGLLAIEAWVFQEGLPEVQAWVLLPLMVALEEAFRALERMGAFRALKTLKILLKSNNL
jgi:hypothetical protein